MFILRPKQIWIAFWLILFSLFFSQKLKSQPSLDSLYQVWENPKESDSIRFNAFSEYAWEGFVYTRPDSAEKLSEILLDFANEKKNSFFLIEALKLKSTSIFMQSATRRARDIQFQILDISQQEGNPKAQAEANQNIGMLYAREGKYDSSIIYLNHGFSLFKEQNDYENQLLCLHYLGRSYLARGEYKDAISHFEQYKKIGEIINSPEVRAKAIYQIGIIHGRQSDYQKALEFHFAALDSLRKVGALLTQGQILRDISFLYLDQGFYPQSLRHSLMGLKIFEEIGDLDGQAKCLLSIGNTYNYNGEREKAVEHFKRSIKIEQKKAQRLEKLINPRDQPIPNFNPVKESNAPQKISRNLIAKGTVSHLEHLGRVKDYIGNLYVAIGDYENTRKAYQESYEVFVKTGSNHGQVNELAGLSFISLLLKDTLQAEKFFLKTAEKRIEIGDQKGLADTYLSLGELYLDLKDYQKASYYLEKCLNTNRNIENIKGQIEALMQLQKLDRLQNNYSAAINKGKAILRMAKSIGEVNHLKNSAFELYLLYRITGQKGKALDMYELHINVRDSVQNESNQRELLKQEYQYNYEKQALADSLEFVQQKSISDLAYQKSITNRNYWFLAIFGITVLVFFFFYYRQQMINRRRKLELEQERVRKEQLANLNRFKSQFFTNISHEFRTPLTLVIGQNQQLQAEIDNPKLDPKFDRIDRNGKKLLELVNQVLDLSKLESGNLELKTETIDLVPFLKNILFSFESMADQKDQILEFQTKSESQLIIADPEKLERIFYNLIGNALKFTPEKGTISISLERHENQLTIQVKDTGIGILPEKLPNIFDRFFQGEGGNNHPNPGSGIGLALVKELVELHEGKIRAESQYQKGSNFIIQLPVAKDINPLDARNYILKISPEENNQAVKENSQISASEGKRVLIVEDNPDVRVYLKEELQSLSYQVLEAVNGKEGLKMAKTHLPDLIVSDVMMPKMDGFQFTEALRSNIESSHIPIILLTAKAGEESKLAGLKTGADAYLTKPFNRSELEVRIKNLIEQRTLLRQRFSEQVVIKPEEVSAVPADQKFLTQITELIENNMSNEQLGVGLICQEIGISHIHLNRKLNALIGQSAGKLIRSMKLQKAADLLRKESITISEISFMVGFENPTHFARSFKKQFGVSPKEYRQGGE